MRNSILGIILFCASSFAIALPEQNMMFDGLKFQHTWENNETIITHEYVEEGHTLDNWEHLLAYRQYPGHENPVDVVKQYLAQIKPTQKPAIYRKGEKGNDLILVFLIEPSDKRYLEFNIHRFVLEEGMVRSYQFAARNFKRKLSVLSDEILANKNKWIGLVGKLKADMFNKK